MHYLLGLRFAEACALGSERADHPLQRLYIVWQGAARSTSMSVKSTLTRAFPHRPTWMLSQSVAVITRLQPDATDHRQAALMQVKTDSWNNEQIHGGNVRRVVTKEGLPRARDLRQVGRGLGVRYVPDCARERFMVASGIGRRDDPAVRSRVL